SESLAEEQARCNRRKRLRAHSRRPAMTDVPIDAYRGDRFPLCVLIDLVLETQRVVVPSAGRAATFGSLLQKRAAKSDAEIGCDALGVVEGERRLTHRWVFA